MAFAAGASTSASATSTGLTVSHTTGAGENFMTVEIGIRGTQTVTMTYNGVALTLDDEYVDPTDPERVAVLSLVGPASGAHNLVVSLSGSVLHFVSIQTWTVDAGTATKEVAAHSSNSGTVVAPSVTLPASTGGLVVDCASTERNVSPPWTGAGGDQTVIHNTGSGSYGIGTSYELNPSSGETMNWTDADNQTWVQVAVVYLEGTPPTPPTPPLGVWHPILAPKAWF